MRPSLTLHVACVLIVCKYHAKVISPCSALRYDELSSLVVTLPLPTSTSIAGQHQQQRWLVMSRVDGGCPVSTYIPSDDMDVGDDAYDGEWFKGVTMPRGMNSLNTMRAHDGRVYAWDTSVRATENARVRVYDSLKDSWSYMLVPGHMVRYCEWIATRDYGIVSISRDMLAVHSITNIRPSTRTPPIPTSTPSRHLPLQLHHQAQQVMNRLYHS